MEPTDTLVRAWFEAEERQVLEWREGRIGWVEQRRRRLREFLPLAGLPVGPDAALDDLFTSGYLAAYEREWAGFPDADGIVHRIRGAGYATAVLTNGAEEQQRAKLARLGLLDVVGPVLTAEGIGVAKPHRAAFLRLCERLDLPPAQVLSVGDDDELDVRAARAAGLQAVLVDRSGRPPTRDEPRLTSLEGLPDHLAGLRAAGR